MTNIPASSRWLAVAALSGLALILWWRLPDGGLKVMALLPVVILLLTGLRPQPRWGGWAAVIMIPYVCLTVMDTLLSGESRVSAAAAAVCSVVVFFAGLDSVRRNRVSLRR